MSSKALKLIKVLVIVVSLSLWPTAFLLKNNVKDTLFYFFPALLITCSIIIYSFNRQLWILPLIPITYINPSLSILPVSTAFLNLLLNKGSKLSIIFLVITLVISLHNVNRFIPRSIFTINHDEIQNVIQTGYLYPNVWMSRLFQNKPNIYLSKFKNNFFALIDPNNYFFGFHPREIYIDNQNLDKFPFLSIFFFIFGMYFIKDSKYLELIIIMSLAVIFNLSMTKNFDRIDFVMFPIISLVIIHGIKKIAISLKRCEMLIYLFFLSLSFVELARIIIIGLNKL